MWGSDVEPCRDTVGGGAKELLREGAADTLRDEWCEPERGGGWGECGGPGMEAWRWGWGWGLAA